VRVRLLPAIILAILILPAAASAQGLSRPVMEASGGHAAFLDESAIHHFTLGTAWRWNLGRRVSVGPEVVFMRGPDGDRDVFLTGKVVVDFLPTQPVSPYFVADGGLMLHRTTFTTVADYWAKEGAVSFGGGVRINVTPRVFFAPEFRVGWEPHFRVSAVVGWRM
jgi:hypothetical protein